MKRSRHVLECSVSFRSSPWSIIQLVVALRAISSQSILLDATRLDVYLTLKSNLWVEQWVLRLCNLSEDHLGFLRHVQAVRSRRNRTQGILALLLCRGHPHHCSGQPRCLAIVDQLLPGSAIDAHKHTERKTSAIRGVADRLLASDLEAAGLTEGHQPRLDRLDLTRS